MSKRKEDKKRKKVKSLVLLLVLTIIMFSTATYAWFTANQTVTVSTLDVHVEASNGLQISTNASEWKTVITNADITAGYAGAKNMVPATLNAVSTDGTVSESELNMYKGVVGSDAQTGEYTITAAKSPAKAGSTGDYIAFDMFLRVDQAQTIYLTTSSNVMAKEGTEDKGLKNAARVGFVTLGNASSETAAGTLQALNTPAATAIIWEPNADAHTARGNASAIEYSITVDDKTNRTGYFGLKQEIANQTKLKDAMNGTDTTNTAEVTPNVVTPEAYAGAYQQVVRLEAGVTKIRVYMWVEGQDVDCENNASGTDISYNVQLSTQSSAAGN